MTQPQLDTQGEAREALNSAVADFGQRVLSNPDMIRSRMSDLLPDLPRERHLLVTAAEADVAGELAKHVQDQHLDPEAAIELVSRSLSKAKSIDLASSTWVTTEYAQALGYRVGVGPAATPPPPPPAAAAAAPEPEPEVPGYTPAGSPALRTASPPAAAAATIPGGYAGHPPPPAPAGDGGYVAPAPPAGGGGYVPPQGPGAGQAAPAGAPPWTPPAPPASTRRNNRWQVFALAGVVVVGLIVGLIVWAPWHKVPVPPVAIHGQSPTATSVLVSWTPSSGGATIDRYLILRDGTQVGSVPAGRTSYLDQGLAPGTTHRYKIIAVSGTQRSQPSASIVVRTITPSPVGLAAGQITYTDAQFAWSPPPNSPPPSEYTIFVNGAQGATVPGGLTSYNATGLQAGTSYQYQVVAAWGDRKSVRSAALTLSTLAPPLQGSQSLEFKTLSTPGSGASLKVGETWSDSWTFNPSCTGDHCTLATDAEFAPPGFGARPFTVNLTGTNGAYTGSTLAYISYCGSVRVQDTVILSLSAKSGGVDNGAWNLWGGTMDLNSPYVTAGSQYCPAQSWTFSLTGTDS